MCSSDLAPAAPAQPKHQSTPEVRQRLKAVGAIAQAISAEVQKVIIGKPHVIDNVLINILSNGNLLFEDYPGLAKTLSPTHSYPASANPCCTWLNMTRRSASDGKC